MKWGSTKASYIFPNVSWGTTSFSRLSRLLVHFKAESISGFFPSRRHTGWDLEFLSKIGIIPTKSAGMVGQSTNIRVNSHTNQHMKGNRYHGPLLINANDTYKAQNDIIALKTKSFHPKERHTIETSTSCRSTDFDSVSCSSYHSICLMKLQSWTKLVETCVKKIFKKSH